MIRRDEHISVLRDFVRVAADCVEAGAQKFLEYAGRLGRENPREGFNIAVLNFGAYVLEADKPLGSEREISHEQNKLFPGTADAIALSRTLVTSPEIPPFIA